MWLLGIVSIIYVVYQLIKESCEKPIPAEYWANKELYHQDMMNGVSVEQRMKYVKQGRYILPKETVKEYPKPHRCSKTGKVIIENCELYNQDIKKYGVSLTYKWVSQGKYNLTSEELKITHLQYAIKTLELYGLSRQLSDEENDKIKKNKEIIDNYGWNCRNTKGYKTWKKLHDEDKIVNKN